MAKSVGGATPKIDTGNAVEIAASKIALEVFPLTLLESPSSDHSNVAWNPNFGATFHRLPETAELINAAQLDESLSKLFTHVGDNDNETFCRFKTSTGRGGSLQLSLLPMTIVSNAIELMRLRGDVSQKALLNAVKEEVQMLRDIGEGRQITVPAFLGVHNIGFENFNEISIEGGTLRAYTPELMSLLPQRAKPSVLAGSEQTLGVVLEYDYPYKAELVGEDISQNWPVELEQARQKLKGLSEDLALSLALSVDRSPCVGVVPAWDLVFDPLCYGSAMSWNANPRSPMPPHLLQLPEVEAVQHWSKLVFHSEDQKIRIAIRRILAATSSRLDPVDGFIDIVIAWENLFGANGELSYRISVSMAVLLADDIDARLDIQNKIKKFYNDRSLIVHGVKELDHATAAKKRDECLRITMDTLKALYEKYGHLLADAERSRTLALL